jgi:hypothetical protein
MIDRAVKEQATHARLIAAAEALGDPSLEFAERSRLYRDRGLASDTSLRINFALELALRVLTPVRSRGSDPITVRRVAVIGPGLDFADKQEGYDFYPPQTIQPFAILDSLIRLGHADANTVEVTTFDVSARVNDHLEQAQRRAVAGSPYIIHAPLETGVAWTPDLVRYFETFGSAIGSPVPVAVPPGVGAVRVRAVSVRPAFVERVRIADVNITAQQLTLEDRDRFDLIVGTNVFVYYDRLQQGLAMTAVARVLRPGESCCRTTRWLRFRRWACSRPATRKRSIPGGRRTAT